MAEGQLQVVVGVNLRRVRRQLGYSQESFGEHVGWHRTFVGAVERGERNLTLRTVERLALQLGIHPLDLLFDRDGVAILRAEDDTPQFVDRPSLRAAAERGRKGTAAANTRRARPKPA
jgi:transcriptional regulator with XRE-family HTH domain